MLKADLCRDLIEKVRDAKTTTTATTMTATTTTNNKSIESRYLANYIRNVQQASKGTAAQYEYRLSRFEKYIAKAYKEESQKQQDQELKVALAPMNVRIADNKRRNVVTIAVTLKCSFIPLYLIQLPYT
jgi:glucose-6-phosphate isomerase